MKRCEKHVQGCTFCAQNGSWLNTERNKLLFSFVPFHFTQPKRSKTYLGVLLDTFNACFSLTEAKCKKSLLFLSVLDKINSVFVHILQCLIGFHNFIFELVSYFSLLRTWFNQLKSFKSSRLKFPQKAVQIICDLLSSPNCYRS